MNQSKEFAEGMVYALQHIRDFEIKHGHLYLDAVTANALSASIPDYAIIFHSGKFQVVNRTAPGSENFITPS